ncbi:hypothetical protein D0865_10633 [Hortaea werneckii]|uniref:MHD domain-containing protein n=1 Tax=Hortaea werneckii TaxID=91943 RepID=A0A3M7BX38_HORWE|nr:hypothetical protein D0865_10633 [Hortaea werneckii]
MDNAAQRSDYPNIVAQVPPSQAVDVLNDRVRQINKLNTSVADWLRERRQLEEQYASGLKRLARKQLEECGDIGIFSVPWDALKDAAGTMADSHSTLASKIGADAETPLRDFGTNNREMQAMTTIQGNLASMARDVDRAQQKIDRLVGKGDKAETNKVASATSELDNANGQWESQAPFVFENLQAVDESRLNLLRDALTQIQTHEVDLVTRTQSGAEHCLNVLLSMQTEDEIKTFTLKAAQGRLRAERPHRPSVPTPSRAAPPSGLQTPTAAPAEDESQRSESIPDDKRRSKFLNRMGTVLKGKRGKDKAPAQLEPMSESPERKPKASPFGGSFGNRLGKSKNSTLDAPDDSSTRDRPRSPLRRGSEVMETPAGDRDVPKSPGPAEPAPQTNGVDDITPIPGPVQTGGHQGDLAGLEPPKAAVNEPEPAPEPQQDSEGFTVRPEHNDPIMQAQMDAAATGETTAPAYNVNIRDAPIQEEGGDSDAALASMANKLQAPPSTVGRSNTVRGRRGRPVSSVPSTFIPPAEETVPEPTKSPTSPSLQTPTEATTESAREMPTSPQLPTQPTSQPTSPGTAPALSPSPSGAFAPAAAGAGLGAVGGGAAGAAFSPFSSSTSPFRPESRATGDHTTDAGSIRSGRSLTSSGSQGLGKHTELHEPGLNSSIVETVSARFEDGNAVHSSLTGEIALAYHPADFSSPFGTENIKLENFSSLEKVAPNPAFITQVPEKEGEYSINLGQITKTQIAFKYQVRGDDNGSQAPLLIKPAFRIEATQASVIVNYSLNPAFDLHGRESITLSGVMLALTLEGAKATSCQSKPQGSFSRERNLIYWQLGEITLKAGAAPEKLLARFATESEATGGHVETRWEVTGEHAANLGSGLAVSMQGQGAGGEGADPFADEDASAGAWKNVQGARKLVSGTYSAK